jgi:hypothetical protein
LNAYVETLNYYFNPLKITSKDVVPYNKTTQFKTSKNTALNQAGPHLLLTGII